MRDLRQTARQCGRIRDRLFRLERRPIGVFVQRVRGRADPDRTLLELGCGRRAVLLRMLAGDFGECYGVDEHIPAASREGKLSLLPASPDAVPLEDESVDIIMSANLVEHLADPLAVLRECRRLLKPQGQLFILTANALSLSLALERSLPRQWRARLSALATGAAEAAPAPAHYRANSARALQELGRSAGLMPRSIEYIADHPYYLMFSVWAYRLGATAERLLLRPRRLAFLRHSLVCHFQKAPSRLAARQRKCMYDRVEGSVA